MDSMIDLLQAIVDSKKLTDLTDTITAFYDKSKGLAWTFTQVEESNVGPILVEYALTLMRCLVSLPDQCQDWRPCNEPIWTTVRLR